MFAGPFSVAAAESVIGGVLGEDAVRPGAIFDILASLLDKSLVRKQGDGGTGPGTGLLTMLDTIREYACERLRETGLEPALADRHAEFYLGMAEEAEAALWGAEQGMWLGRLESKHENLRAALTGCLERGEAERALRFGAALWRFWTTRGYLNDGRAWVERALALPGGSSAARIRAAYGAGVLCLYLGRLTEAEEHLRLSFHLALEEGDVRGMGNALNNLGIAAHCRGDAERAENYYRESLEIRRRVGAPGEVATSLHNLGEVAAEQGDLARAEALQAECLVLWRQSGDLQNVGNALAGLSELARERGDWERALALAREALVLWRDLAYRPGLALLLDRVAGILQREGDPERAARLMGAAMAIRQEMGAPSPALQGSYRENLERTRAALGHDRFAAMWDIGRRMTFEEAMEHALAGRAPSSPTARPAEGRAVRPQPRQ